MKYKGHIRHMIAAATLLLTAWLVPTLTSCNDEPEYNIRYFISVVYNVDGLNYAVQKSDPAWVPAEQMLQAIKEVYPKPLPEGNDQAVYAACRAVYDKYCQENPDAIKFSTCKIKIYRARCRGDIVISTQYVMSYNV